MAGCLLYNGATGVVLSTPNDWAFMKQLFSLLVVAAFSTAFAFGQLTITGTSPANGTTNVSLGSTLSLTFNTALDSLQGLVAGKSLLTNVEFSGSPVFSPDKRTVTIPVSLTAGTAYFFCVSYAKGQDASTLAAPYIFYFTTAASFPTTTVSGTVTSGSPSIDPGGTLVVLSSVSIGNQDPVFVMGSIADGSGAFTIPYVANGGYFPIGAKDVNNDGDIDPSQGDAVGQGDSITVSGSNVSGVAISLTTYEPMEWDEVVDSAMVMAATLPSDRSLRWVRSWDTDSLGMSEEWTFHYIIPSTSAGWDLKVRSMEKRIDSMDPWAYTSCIQMAPITNIAGAATATTFLTNVENAGGREFRRQDHGDSLTFMSYTYLGQLQFTELWDLVPVPSELYWGAIYTWGVETDSQFNNRKSMKVIGDFYNGLILATTDVRSTGDQTIPDRTTLQQNYPNPFNPSTVISFTLPVAGEASMKVYNLVGQEITTIFNGRYDRGSYEVRFEGAGLPSGMYFYVLEANGTRLVQKMALVR